MNAWNVYDNGKLIDTVHFNKECDKDYVLQSLIDQDGYPCTITVKKS